MADAHLAPELLERFAGGAISADDRRAVIRHLLRGCDECSRIAAGSWPLGLVQTYATREESPEFLASYGRLLGRLEEREAQLSQERNERDGLVAELDSHPFSRRVTLILNSRRFSTWALAEALIERCRTRGFDSPAEAREDAELAVEVSNRLAPDRYGLAAVNDLRARARAYLGNARRILSDFQGAAEEFARARALLREGSGDPLEGALLLHLQASLLVDQGRFLDADHLLSKAARSFERGGDNHAVGRALLGRANVRGFQGEFDAAISLLAKALSLLEADREPRMVLGARYNLVFFKAEAGHYFEARAELQGLRPLLTELTDAMTLLRLRWLEGKIAAGLGEQDEAERAFLAVRDGFLKREIPFEVALVSLELGVLYFQQGRLVELKRLVAEMLPIFTSLEVHRETIAALLLLKQAVEAETVTLAFLKQIAVYLEQVPKDPSKRFVPPA